MCELETPFLTQAKVLGSYTLPWGGIRVSGTLTNYPGPVILANAVFSSAQVAASLGRPLTGASAVTLGIVRPHTLYGERRNQVDLRFARGVRVGATRIEGLVDFFNLLNENAVTIVNVIYGTTGANWQQPLSILPSRLVKFGVQVYF